MTSSIDWSECRAQARTDKTTITLANTPSNPDHRRVVVHNCIVAAVQYGIGAEQSCHDGVGDEFMRELQDSATDYVIATFRRVNPQDPLEEMLLTQAIVTHARMMWLNRLAMRQSDRRSLQTVNEAADRAANTYRRQMLALKEYRRPSKTFIAVRQTNMANQQVVQNGILNNENTTNEQGSTDAKSSHSGPKALPDDAGGVGLFAGIHCQSEAVAAEHGADDAGGQGQIQDECRETRGAKRGSNGRAARAGSDPEAPPSDAESR